MKLAPTIKIQPASGANYVPVAPAPPSSSSCSIKESVLLSPAKDLLAARKRSLDSSLTPVNPAKTHFYASRLAHSQGSLQRSAPVDLLKSWQVPEDSMDQKRLPDPTQGLMAVAAETSVPLYQSVFGQKEPEKDVCT